MTGWHSLDAQAEQELSPSDFIAYCHYRDDLQGSGMTWGAEAEDYLAIFIWNHCDETRQPTHDPESALVLPMGQGAN